jgi:hypothetical protein
MLTQQDLDDYGPAFIDMTRRAAVDAVAPELQQLRAQNQQLRQMAARAQNTRIQQALDQALPHWRSTYANPAFSEWLESPDPYAGEPRAQLLRRAVAAGVRFYAGFEREAHHAPAGHQRAQQSRPAASGGNIYTCQQITDFYKRRRDGLISDADWARREADIVRAASEGRVVGALNLTDGTEMSRLR